LTGHIPQSHFDDPAPPSSRYIEMNVPAGWWIRVMLFLNLFDALNATQILFKYGATLDKGFAEGDRL
jgi:hypothetical protein